MAILVLTDAPAAAVYALASFVAVVATAFHPAQSALLTLARTNARGADRRERQLEHARESGHLRRPRSRWVLLALTNVWVVFVDYRRSVPLVDFHARPAATRIRAPADPRAASSASTRATAGFRAIGRDPRLRLVISLFGAQTLVNGAFGVLVAVSAFQLLDLGSGRRRLPDRRRRGWRASRRSSLTRPRRAIGGLRRRSGSRWPGTGGPLLLLGGLPRDRCSAHRLRADRVREHHLRRLRLYDPAAGDAE